MKSLLLEKTRAVLAVTPVFWEQLSQKVSDDLLRANPAEGEWSALDCLQHLIDTERWVFPRRVEYFLAGQDFPAFDPDSQGTRTKLEISSVEFGVQFCQLREESLTLLDRLSPADLARQARHAELGLVTLDEMLHEWAGHDLMHTVQAERALMQPFIEGCGPWREYFKDHIA